jgi:hypothetical protein
MVVLDAGNEKGLDMPFCPSCGAEFRAGFTQCNTCDVPLVASLAAPEEESGSELAFAESALQLLSTFSDESQAAFMRRLLDEAGVPSVLQGGHAQNVAGCEPYRLLVDEDYFEAAQETIASFNSPSLITGQIEGNLGRLREELDRTLRERAHLAPRLRAVSESIARLQADLGALNRELDEEE